MRLSATLACHMRLERFPMDVQVIEPIKIILQRLNKPGLHPLRGAYYDLLAVSFESRPKSSFKTGIF